MNATFVHVELFIVLITAMLALTVVARRLVIPYPILLVLGGLALAFTPGMPVLALDPDVVFVVFLPPILWAAAYFTSIRDFRHNLRSISLLAVGLVLITTAAVAWVAQAIIPGIGWAAAFCLGAIVSPPDAVAATAVLSRVGVPRQIITILEGESLVNDATALVLYRAAVMAMVSGSFSLGATVGSFFVVATLGVVIGLLVGRLVRWAVVHTPDGYAQVALTLLGPYVAWVAAERLHASPVLACVAGGLYVRKYFSSEVSPLVRLQARSVWDLLIFLLNGVIFILIGLELGPLRRELSPGMLGEVLRWGTIITLTAIVVRLVWMPLGARLVRVGRGYRARNPVPPWRGILMSGWTAMRGIVSLATALALPLTTASGERLPFRSEIILITFVVILGTLVVQGLTLAPLARILGLSGDDRAMEHEHRIARERSARAALQHLDALSREDGVPLPALDAVRARYERLLRRFGADAALDPDHTQDFTQAQRRLRVAALDAERRELIRLRNGGEISDEVLHEVERELDVEALRQGVGHVVSSPAP